MKDYQNRFISLALEHRILTWGDFTLKSGRHSPYFFNLGKLSSARALEQIADYFCDVIAEQALTFDLFFGPAYKGIPLVAATALKWLERTGQDTPFAYSRKEKKDHGEGGQIVGDIQGKRILILDDVLTAGTAARESLHLIQQAGGIPSALLIALDREETGQTNALAREELQQEFGITVHAILTAQELLSIT